MKKAFTLVEMLVVIGIIALLMGASIAGFSGMKKRAEKARGRELVSNTATALNMLLQRQNRWPPKLVAESNGGGRLTKEAGACLAVNDLMSLSYKKTTDDEGESTYVLTGLDGCGIVTPWATAVLKRMSSPESGSSAKVPSGGTVEDHQLHFAVDDDGDGKVVARLGSKSVTVRANAVVWCWGYNGKEDDYEASMSSRGGADDIYSWSRAQEVK